MKCSELIEALNALNEGGFDPPVLYRADCEWNNPYPEIGTITDSEAIELGLAKGTPVIIL